LEFFNELQDCNLVANAPNPPVINWPFACIRFGGVEMVGDNMAAYSIANDDCLENRLKEATAEDTRQLLEQFLLAFCQSEVALRTSGLPALSNP
jgi:hypothetical protein